MRGNCCNSRALLVLSIVVAMSMLEAGALNNSDTDALWDFYGHVQDPRGQLANWSVDTSPCQWAGLTCGDGENVTTMRLLNFGLSGTLSESIGNIANLQVLDLTNNAFSGGVPRSISKLAKLTNFTASQNNLSGSIPDDLGSSGSLNVVDLSENRFSGPIPSAICRSPGLTIIALGKNALIGSIPANISDCGSLQVLYLGTNSLEGLILESIGALTKLVFLDLSVNNFTGAIPATISNCQFLERIFLGSNQLSGGIPDSIGTLKNLQILDLSSNHFKGEIPLTFNQNNLKYLSLESNQLQGVISPQLGTIVSLQLLSLAGNALEGPIPFELGRITHLVKLLLNNNRLNGSIPPSISNMTVLEDIDLSSNLLTGEIPSDLGRLNKLESLALGKNKLTGNIPTSLESCSSLLSLDLSQNDLSGEIPPQIGNISLLTYFLNLSWNNLSGPIPSAVGKLEKLQSLDLSHNHLEGEVPDDLSNLKSLLSIDLSYNSLIGNLPAFRQWMVNVTQVEGNPGLCGAPLAPCDNLGNPSGSSHHTLRVWVAIITGIAVALFLLLIVGVILFYWRMRYGYAPTEVEPKTPSAEGRLFEDDDRPLSFNFEEVVEATQRISEYVPVGKGRFSTVYKVDMPSGQEIAVKKLKVDTENSSLTRRFTAELYKIDKMQHRNILRLLGYVLQGDSLLLCYDFCSNGSLGEWLHRRSDSVLEWSTRYKIAIGAAQGLAFLHHSVHPPFVHRDVSTNNILLDASFEPLLGDVGLGRIYDPSKETESMTAVAGSFGYIAPEYAYTMRVTEKSNVYSFGVVLLEILTGKQPIEPSFGEGCDLVSWVLTAPQRNETPEQLLDASVSTASFPVRQEMLNVLKVAKLCTSSQPTERPKMKGVVEMLQKCKHAIVQPFSVQNV